jgi:drug/metabolite transporter (DMT)-like permease
VAALLALLSAVWFALSAALQQRGQFTLARGGTPVEGVTGLFRLLAVPVWLLGTLILFAGYATQGAALDRGKLVVVQPLMVTTIVWALPLGHWLSGQQVVRRQVLGAGVVVVGLAMFVLVGDPDAGVDSAKTQSLVIAALVISAIVAALLLWLHSKSSWALLGFGFIAFVIQQMSLATGQLAPAMAAVSVANPAVSVILGIILFEERLTRPSWHVVVAIAALLAALAGAVLITLANRETGMPGVEASAAETPHADPSPA